VALRSAPSAPISSNPVSGWPTTRAELVGILRALMNGETQDCILRERHEGLLLSISTDQRLSPPAVVSALEYLIPLRPMWPNRALQFNLPNRTSRIKRAS
jgi:hypothetical protein